MIKRTFAFSLSLPILLSACATAQKSTALGAGIGSAAGMGLGILVGNQGAGQGRTKGAMIGLGLGGLLGGLIGFETHKEQTKRNLDGNLDVKATRIDMFGSASDPDKRPTLKPAQVKVRYVEDQIKEGTFVPAHFEYEIAEPARWDKSK